MRHRLHLSIGPLCCVLVRLLWIVCVSGFDNGISKWNEKSQQFYLMH